MRLKTLICLPLLICLWIELVPLVAAQSPTMATVNYYLLNLRSAPGTSSSVIGQLDGGDRVEILDQESYVGSELWVYVRVVDGRLAGSEGWVFEPKLCYTPVFASVNPDRLNVRAEPNPDAPLVGTFTAGTVVEILGRDDVKSVRGFWVYVRQVDNGLTGWIDRSYLNRITRGCPASVLMTDQRTPASPIQTQGLILAHVPRHLYHVYREVHPVPDLDAAILGTVSEDSMVAVWGQDESGHWLYVRTLDGSLAGWLWKRLVFPVNYDTPGLPILAPVAAPELPANGLQPIDSLAAVVTREYDGQLFSQPGDDGYLMRFIPVGSPLILVGRNANSSYFKTSFEGDEGWIRVWDITLEGDPNRLPVMSLKGSPDDHIGD